MDILGQEIVSRLWDEHSAPLVLYAQQLCDDPEDVVQEAFLLLVRQGAVLDNPKAWLYRVVRYRAINAARAGRRRSRRETAKAVRGEPWFETTAGDRLDAAAATEALKQLPVEQREAIVARLWGGLSFEEICAPLRQFHEHGLPLLSTGASSPARKARLVMSSKTNENENEDLKAFEAALGALRPRSDRLDRRWRSLLAQEASLTEEQHLPSPDQPSVGARRGAGGEGHAATASDETTALTLALSRRERGPNTRCVNPTGHQFICIYCGSAAPISGTCRRWGWPTALLDNNRRCGRSAGDATEPIGAESRIAGQLREQCVLCIVPRRQAGRPDFPRPVRLQSGDGKSAARVFGFQCRCNILSDVARSNSQQWTGFVEAPSIGTGDDAGNIGRAAQLSRTTSVVF